MESVVAFNDGELDFSKIFSIEDNLDDLITSGFSGSSSSPITPSGFFPNPEANFSGADIDNESLNNYLLIANSHLENFFSDFNQIAVANDVSIPMNFSSMDGYATHPILPQFPHVNEFMNTGSNVGDSLAAEEMQLKRKIDSMDDAKEIMKKKNQINFPRGNKKIAQTQKKQKLSQNRNNDKQSNAGAEKQSSSSYNSEDDNVSQDSNGGASSESKTAVVSTGKMRASRGSATDPQSLYARKRRERINERLRILQNLVPNGTKVDISTMLEEAVHYVKFLQLQIKLLSSDDLWMYAPLAYNGIDIGLNQKISMFL